MKKLIFMIAAIVSYGWTRELSCRIRSLGEDLAYLIPDYETDVIYNPVFMNDNLLGFYYNTVEETPIKVTFLYRFFGLHGCYWPQNDYNFYDNGTSWEVNKIFSDRLLTEALFKIKKIGLSFTPDIDRRREQFWNSANIHRTDSRERYLYKISIGYKLSEHFYLFANPALGLWEKRYVEQGLDINHIDLIIPTGRLKALYRDIRKSNSFFSAYFDIGGPISFSEMDQSLFNPVLNKGPLIDTIILPFYNTGSLLSGVGFGVPVGDKSMFVLGLNEKYVIEYVPVKNVSMTQIDSFYLSQSNRASLAIAIEHFINKFIVRFGAYCSYNYREDSRQMAWFGKWALTYKDRSDALDYSYNIGFGWMPSERVEVEWRIQKPWKYYYPYDWSLNIKYHF